jgi:TolB-like protein/Tfp pilus assembly protein PilF
MRAPAPSIRLAVLPFANLSGDPAQEYLSDGLTQEMIVRLGSLHPDVLSVIGRTSVMRYKNTNTPIDQIGRELTVGYVLEGSARREGSRVRVSAELIQVKNQSQVWADSFEREMSGILALQADVAREVADSLALRLLPAEQARLAGAAKPVNPEAFEAYLRGIQHANTPTPQNLDAALEYFDVALQKDPNWARAYAEIAGVWLTRQQLGFSAPAEAAPKLRAAALKAIELDGTLPNAHATLALLHFYVEWDWAGAVAEIRKAIELDPGSGAMRAGYAHFLMLMKRPGEAMTQSQRALELDPLDEMVQLIYGQNLAFAGHYDEAIVQFRKALSTTPGLAFARWALSKTLFQMGLYEQSVAELKAYYNSLADREAEDALTQGYAQSGYSGAMRRAADVLAERSRKTYVCPTDVASLYIWAGEKDRALEWLEKGLEARDGNLPWVSVDSNFASLLSEPRFQALLRKMNLPH